MKGYPAVFLLCASLFWKCPGTPARLPDPVAASLFSSSQISKSPLILQCRCRLIFVLRSGHPCSVSFCWLFVSVLRLPYWRPLLASHPPRTISSTPLPSPAFWASPYNYSSGNLHHAIRHIVPSAGEGSEVKKTRVICKVPIISIKECIQPPVIQIQKPWSLDFKSTV